MSRMSLRRQVLYRNVDRRADGQELCGSNRRSHGKDEGPVEELESILAQMEEQQDAGNQAAVARFPVDQGVSKRISPPKPPRVYRLSQYDGDDVSYDEPWTPTEPGTPGIYRSTGMQGPGSMYRAPGGPVDKSTPIPHVNRNTQQDSRVFRYSNIPRVSQRDHPVSLSPIPTRGSHRTPLTPSPRQATSDNDVPTLPMSPAAFLVQSPANGGTHGYGPHYSSDPAMKDPLCHTVLEETTVDPRPLSELSLPAWGQMCRICHEDGARERLVSPCHCKGTMGMLHMNCLERWLGSSNTTRCEICAFKFTVVRCPRPITWYLKQPQLKQERKSFLTDVILSICLFVFVVAVCVMCFIYGLRLNRQNRHVASTIVIMVSLTTCLLYAVWSWCAFPRIQRQLDSWKKKYHVITIKQDTGKKSKDSARTPKKKIKSNTKTNLDDIAMSERPLQNENGHDLTSLDVDSPSVISLEDTDYVR